jgi:beta-glucosidase
MAQRGLERLGEALLGIGPRAQAIDDDFDRVLDVLRQARSNPLDAIFSPKTIAVIGTDAMEGRLGGYSGPGNNVVSILDGVRQRAGKKTQVLYAAGCGRRTEEWALIGEQYLFSDAALKTNGLNAEYYNNIQLAGTAYRRSTDKQVNFHWTIYGPDGKPGTDQYSVRWTGRLRSPVTGKYKIGLEGNDGFRLYINEKLVINGDIAEFSFTIHFDMGHCEISVFSFASGAESIYAFYAI